MFVNQNVVIVEALKNIAGICYFPDYFSYNDLNLRKHQAQHCTQATSSMLSAPSAAASVESAPIFPEASMGTSVSGSQSVAAEEEGNVEEGVADANVDAVDE